jgi:hypothetical protein
MSKDSLYSFESAVENGKKKYYGLKFEGNIAHKLNPLFLEFVWCVFDSYCEE